MDDPIFQAFPFFSRIPVEKRNAILGRAVRKHLNHKQVIVGTGTACSYLPFVLEGTLRIYKTSETGREITLYRIERGESCVLTATCILNGGDFPAIAEAEGDTEVLLLPAPLLVRLVEESPAWRGFVFGLYSRRLEIMLSLVEEVAFHHVDIRIAAFLLKTAAGHRVVDRTHAEIAAELGTSREVVTRILRDFEAEGLILTERGRIRVVKPAGLEKKTAIDPAI